LEEVVYCSDCREECFTCEQPEVNTASNFTNRVTVILSPYQDGIEDVRPRKARVVTTIALLDTGATESNFISRTLAEELVSQGGEILVGVDRVICSAFGSRCVNTNEYMLFTLTLFNTITNKYEDIDITARVIDGLKVELVIGLQTLGTHVLLPKLLPQLGANRNHTGDKIGATGGSRPKKTGMSSSKAQLLPAQ
jgi:hypothetical protein